MGENLADMVEQAQGADLAASEPTNTTPGTSEALSSFCSTPSTVLVHKARIQKLEAHVVTLLYHIQPWKEKSIVEAQDRVEKNISL